MKIVPCSFPAGRKVRPRDKVQPEIGVIMGRPGYRVSCKFTQILIARFKLKNPRRIPHEFS
jgi:hypothetical protein